jgi:hypothetical protein
MASSASPASPEPGLGNAPATPGSGGGLALPSLMLSLAPLVALGLVRLIAAAVSTLPGAAVTGLGMAVYVGICIGSLAAVITGWRALHRTGRQQPQPAVLALAATGIVLGIAGMLLLLIGGVVVGLLLQSCSANPANCG